MTGGNQPRSSGGRLASGAACFTMFSPSSCTGAASLGDGALTWCLRCTAIHSDIEPSGFAVTVGAGTVLTVREAEAAVDAGAGAVREELAVLDVLARDLRRNA